MRCRGVSLLILFLFLRLSVFGSTSDSADNNSIGAIPFPPETLIATLESRGFKVIGAAVIPNGRNIERNVTSYAQPRSDFAVNPGPFGPSGKPIDPSKTVFFSYTPGNQQLQIIRAKTSKPFDFQIVENYAQGNGAAKPKPVANSGSLCLACHQNGATIFPGGLWDETNLNKKVREKMLGQAKLDSFAKYLLDRYPNDDSRALGSRGSSAVVDLDSASLAASGADRMNPERRKQTCQEICGFGVECRRSMLISALTSNTSGDYSRQLGNAFNDYYQSNPQQSLAAIDDIARFARRDLALESSATINNRRSLGQETCISAGTGEDPLIPRPSGIFSSGGTRLGDILGLGKFRKPIRPISPEIKNLAIGALGAGAACFPFVADSEFTEVLNKIPVEKVVAALSSTRFYTLLVDRTWPPTESQFLAMLKSEAAQPSRIQTAVPEVSHSTKSSEVTFGREFRALMNHRSGSHPGAPLSPQASFKTYCMSCHETGLAPDLPLEDLPLLSNYSGTAGRTVKSMLEGPSRIMPPPGSPMPTEAEREGMLKSMVGRAS